MWCKLHKEGGSLFALHSERLCAGINSLSNANGCNSQRYSQHAAAATLRVGRMARYGLCKPRAGVWHYLSVGSLNGGGVGGVGGGVSTYPC